MRRRELIGFLGVVSWPRLIRAQQPGHTYHIAFIAQPPRSAPQWIEVLGELGRSGFIEGQNLNINPHGFGLGLDAIDATVKELTDTSPDVLYCGGDAVLHAAARATQTVPIIALMDDYLSSGLVNSLAHPGGNLTGVSLFSPELDGKRIGLLIEMLPGARKIAVIADRGVSSANNVKATGEAVRARNIDLIVQWVGHEHEIIPALQAARNAGAEAINVLSSPLLHTAHARILAFLLNGKIPAVFQWPDYVSEGALLAYGPRLSSVFRQVGTQMVKVLKGGKPADIPIELPTRFELAINLQTAEAIGLSVPTLLLAQADQVIE